MEENRRHPRIAIRNLSVDIHDGNEFFQGTVSDISRHGMCMTELPERFDADTEVMTVVIAGKEDYFRMFVRPKWCRQQEENKTVGTEIINISWSWKEFVMKREPLPEKDISDLIRRIHQRQKRRTRP